MNNITTGNSMHSASAIHCSLIIMMYKGGGSEFCNVILEGGVRRFVTTRDEGGGGPKKSAENA